MPVEIKIYHDSAAGTLQELREFSAGLLGTGPQLAPGYCGDSASSAPVAWADPTGAVYPAEATGDVAAEETAKAKRTRRTKAQIEADEAAAKAAAQAPAISATPEDRTNPNDAVAETAEEEADGIEDMADAPVPGAALTTDDLRTVAGLIVRKFDNDVAKAQAACVGVFKANGVESISKCPDDKVAVVHAALLAIANG